MRNPHGTLICPKHGHHNINDWTGKESGPWGVTCGYWRCNDDRCCMIDVDPDNFPLEKTDASRT